MSPDSALSAQQTVHRSSSSRFTTCRGVMEIRSAPRLVPRPLQSHMLLSTHTIPLHPTGRGRNRFLAPTTNARPGASREKASRQVVKSTLGRVRGSYGQAGSVLTALLL